MQMNGPNQTRLNWQELLDTAATIVESYDTSVTLRQLFYRLVAAELLPNTQNAYKALSRYTAVARREGTFTALMDRTRTIHRYPTFDDPDEARGWLSRIYRRDRTENQEHSLYLGVEKHGIVEQLRQWFGQLWCPSPCARRVRLANVRRHCGRGRRAAGASSRPVVRRGLRSIRRGHRP